MNKWLRGVLPKSRKARVILAIFIVCALALIAYLFSGRKSRTGNDFELAQRAARNRQIENLNRDSDGDGLKDWEEAIFHTDPHNPDTDGDGTPDGEEVRLGRDPLKPNTSKDPAHPNDLMASSTPLATVPQADALQPTNLTQRVAQSLGQQLIAQRLMDPTKPLNPETIGRNIANGILAYTPEVPLLTLKNITLIGDRSDTAIQEWVRQFSAVTRASFLATHQIEPLILINALKDENYDALAGIDPYLKAYDELAAAVQKIPAPPAVANHELDFLRITLQFRNIASKFRDAEDDPVTAVAAINPYFDLVREAENWYRDIQQELAVHHLTFQ